MSDLIHFADDASEAVMAGQPGFFDLSDRYEALSAAGDPLERLGSVVDFEVFRSPLVAALRRSVRGKGGRPPFDPVMMFKILVLQALYSLSDEATEFQIKDRLSFQRFLGLGLDGTVPDATTVWLFRERLVQAKAIDRLFARFDAALKDRGYLAMGGQIIDATVVPAPKQRNTEAERQPLPERIARANTRRSKIRAHVEHVFAGQQHRMGLVVRTIGIARATIKIGMANLVYNFQRLAWLEGRVASA